MISTFLDKYNVKLKKPIKIKNCLSSKISKKKDKKCGGEYLMGKYLNYPENILRKNV